MNNIVDIASLEKKLSSNTVKIASITAALAVYNSCEEKINSIIAEIKEYSDKIAKEKDTGKIIALADKISKLNIDLLSLNAELDKSLEIINAVNETKEVVKKAEPKKEAVKEVEEVAKEVATKKATKRVYLKNKTIQELRAICKERGYTGYTRKNKADLITFIKEKEALEKAAKPAKKAESKKEVIKEEKDIKEDIIPEPVIVPAVEEIVEEKTIEEPTPEAIEEVKEPELESAADLIEEEKEEIKEVENAAELVEEPQPVEEKVEEVKPVIENNPFIEDDKPLFQNIDQYDDELNQMRADTIKNSSNQELQAMGVNVIPQPTKFKVVEIKKAAPEVAAMVFGKLKAGVSKIKPFMTKVKDNATEFIDNTKAKATEMVDTAKTKTTEFVDTAKDNVTTFVDNTKTKTTEFVDNTKEKASQVVGNVSGFATNIKDTTSDLVNSKIERMKAQAEVNRRIAEFYNNHQVAEPVVNEVQNTEDQYEEIEPEKVANSNDVIKSNKEQFEEMMKNHFDGVTNVEPSNIFGHAELSSDEAIEYNRKALGM